MQIGIYNYYDAYSTNNKIFDSKAYSIGENLEYPSILLKNELESLSHSIDTLDQHELKCFDKIIFLDYPDKRKINLQQLYDLGIELYLIIFEPEIIKPDNYRKNNHDLFKKIFTWSDCLVDGHKYKKINFSHKIPINFKIDTKKKNKLCALIAGNKKNKDRRELYSQRLKTINFFEKNFPEDFDFYGLGWDKCVFARPFGKLNKLSFLAKMLAKRYKTYKGILDKKIEVLSRYKFSICYENAKDLPGYITEKIFDCFFAGCVPVYWGAPNMDKYIPKECFIDRTEFSNNYELYDYLKTMDDSTYNKYLYAIETYINGQTIYGFSAQAYVKTILDEIL
ncbi:MAG: hypothetical protein GY710_02930 [Desulfobacteraceae bacterium]|nr:hypothetical protein [Desulfobacteraceae bacterium]